MATYTSGTAHGVTYNRGDTFVIATTGTWYGSSDGTNGSGTYYAGTTASFYAYSDYSWSTHRYAIQSSAFNGGVACWVDESAFPYPTSSFNLNILLPDGSEPYTTGAAGSVEFSTNGGSSYTRLYNEPASSYTVGTSFVARNFTPGTGLYLSSVSGMTGSGPWYATQPSGGLTINFQTAWNTYTVSYNANGGSSTPSSQTKTYGQNLTLRGSISRNNSTASGYTVSFSGNGGIYTGSSKTATDTTSYSFSSWKSSATGSTWSAGATNFNENNNTTMTAQWNSSTTRGSITLPTSSSVSRTYYTFSGWNTNSSGTGTDYSGGATYTPTNNNTTLYAKWTANAPINLSLTRSSSTTDSITLTYSDTGVVDTRTVYYKKNGTSGYSSIAITTNPFTLTGLETDTDYDIYYTAANSDNSSSTTVQQFSTLLTNPTITDVVCSNLGPFEVDITVTASITPTRTLNYQFSNDGGSTWTTAQASNTYHWTGLTKETTYTMSVKVIGVHTGTNAIDTYVVDNIIITTPTDQAQAKMKINGSWVDGQIWYKNNGSWVKAKKVYIKKNGEWVVGINHENN